MMVTDKNRCFEEFRKGRMNLYMIVTNDYDGTLRIDNVLFRKASDTASSIIMWLNKEEATKFLTKNDTLKGWKIEPISALTFNKFMDMFDSATRENMLIDLVA